MLLGMMANKEHKKFIQIFKNRIHSIVALDIPNQINFIDKEISIKSIDYYYTNPIARSSKVMSECRQISKKFLYSGIEKAS